MKYLKKFNESVFNMISKSDISEILDILNELSDEGFEFINKDLMGDRLYRALPGQITYVSNMDLKDDKGESEYKSSHITRVKRIWLEDESDNKRSILNKHFNYYESIIFNINIEGFDEEKITDMCVGIYNRLIDCGYMCQLWRPEWKKLRFHVCTSESNPFMDNELLLNLNEGSEFDKIPIWEYRTIDSDLREDIKDMFLELVDDGYDISYHWVPSFSGERISSSNYPFVMICKLGLKDYLNLEDVNHLSSPSAFDRFRFNSNILTEYRFRLKDLLGDDYDIYLEWMGINGEYYFSKDKDYNSFVYRILMVKKIYI